LLNDPVAVATGRPAVALSPDGSSLVVAVEREGTTHLELRRMDEPVPSPIAGTEGASGPFFSPDGISVGFVTWRNLMRISLLGGAAESIIRVPPVTHGVSWGAEDIHIINFSEDGGLTEVKGGEVSRDDFTGSVGMEGSHRWPEFLPDGDTVLFTADKGGRFEEASISTVSLTTGEQKILVEGGTHARYAASGHIVFARDGALFAAPFDVARLEVMGQPERVLDGVMTDTQTGAAHFALSDEGSLIYVEGDAWTPSCTVVRVNLDGNVETLLTEERPVAEPSLSPDGRHLAMTISEGSNMDIWLYTMARGTLTRLTFDSGEDFNPIWSPDGQRIVFASEMSGGAPLLHWMPADGSAAPVILQTGEPETNWLIPLTWSPDGETLSYQTASIEKGPDIWLLPLTGEPEPQPFATTDFDESGASFSPDGRWIAYHTDESGRLEVYVQPFPGPGGKQQVSTDGGAWPVWMPNGGALCFRRGNKLMLVEIDGDTELVLGKPRVLFTGRFTYGIGNHANYSITPDSEGFVLVALEEQEPPKHLNLIVNWFEELKRLVPVDN
jgi:Tol biopolymer transport system component